MTLLHYFSQMWHLALQCQLQGIWFWAGIYCLLLCSYSLLKQIQTRRWPYVMGELLSLQRKEFGAREWSRSEQDYIADALYHYQVDGKEYVGSKISPWIFVVSHNARFVLEKQMDAVQTDPDGKVKVFYHPKKPKTSLLIVAGNLGLLVTCVIALLPLFLFYLRFYT